MKGKRDLKKIGQIMMNGTVNDYDNIRHEMGDIRKEADQVINKKKINLKQPCIKQNKKKESI